MDVLNLTDEQLEQLTDEQIEQLNDIEVTQLKGRLAGLSHQLKASNAHYKLWGRLRETEGDMAEINADKTLADREDWLISYHRNNHLKGITSEEYSEVFMLLKQPFSQIRDRLDELTSKRYWQSSRSLVLYDLFRRTFPVCKQDSALVGQILKAQQEHYDKFFKPYEGLPRENEWVDDCDGWDDSHNYSFRVKMRLKWLMLKYRASVLNAKLNPWHKPWPPRGIEQRLSGSIYEQSPDSLLQLRFSWGGSDLPELDFVPMRPLEHFRFGFNDKFICYSSDNPWTGGCYPWRELIPILENPAGNDADWRFKEGYTFEYCLKDEPKGSSD